MSALAAGSTIGILGGGQLGRMLAMAAAHMGFRVHIYDPFEDSPAFDVAAASSCAAYDDAEALTEFAKRCDIITFEFENVPPTSLELLQRDCTVLPDPQILKTCRHRLREKTAINEAGIATVAFQPINTEADLIAAGGALGYPLVLKTCEMGYDGKGQYRLDSAEDIAPAWAAFASRECIAEAWAAFECEISVIVARDQAGRVRAYEPSLNLHEHHILTRTEVPAQLDHAIAQDAVTIACRLAERLELVGVLAVEFFLMPDGALLVNELAPRPHNSGHWTIEAAATSQFEQHIRAVSGLSLGDTATLCPSVMINLIGEDINRLGPYEQDPQAHIHRYGKKAVREGRKMGHVTLLSP